MHQLICTNPGSFEYRPSQQPERREGWSTIAISRVGICGTDLHAFEGTQPYFTYPRVLGHELAATIMETGNGSGFVPGEWVTVIPYLHCGYCIACRSKKPNCCVHMKVMGVHVDGGMTSWLSVPDQAIIKADGLNPDELALTEPLSIARHGIRRAEVQPGEFVLVAGAGPIGIATMDLAGVAGAQVIAIDINQQRLDFCSDVLDVPYSINAASEDVVEQLMKITSGDMPTVVIDATGNKKAINNALAYLAHGGRYVLIGLQRDTLEFSHPEFHKRESTLMSSRNATREDFLYVMEAIRKEQIRPLNYITHRIDFRNVKDTFAQLLDPSNGVIKALIEME